MISATRFAFAVLVASVPGLLAARTATAAPDAAKAGPIYVLTLSTEDSDDQAEALTQALRSRVRKTPGWSLQESAQSFDTLAIALKCPPKPDSGCLARIADQLHADRFVWGTMSKRGVGQVGADVHLWWRGHGEATSSETYSDNLKDANDESLRGIAGRLFGVLAAGGPGGTLVVHAGSGGGEVLVDGASRAVLEGGVARLEVPPGPHTVTVQVPGFDATPQSTSVGAGVERGLTFALAPAATSGSGAEGGSAFPLRRVVSYTALVVGGALLIASGVETAQWISDSNTSNTDRQSVPRSVTDVCAAQVNAAAQDACSKSRDATSVSTMGWAFGAIGVVAVGSGVVLLLTEHKAATEKTAQAPARRSFDVLPELGPRGGSLGVRVAF